MRVNIELKVNRKRHFRPRDWSDIPSPAWPSFAGYEWHTWDDDIRFLPTEFIISLINPGEYSNMLRLEADYLTVIREDVAVDGVREPLTVVYDDTGVALKDGHHRACVAGQLALERLPVRIKRSRHVTRHKLPLEKLLAILWTDARRFG